MGKKTVKVIYSGERSKELDEFIRECFKSPKFREYGCGYNFVDNERDICFDYIKQ